MKRLKYIYFCYFSEVSSKLKIKEAEETTRTARKNSAVDLKDQAISIFNNNKSETSVKKQKIAESTVREAKSTKIDGKKRLRVGVEFSDLVRGAKSMASFDIKSGDRK